MMGVGFVIEGGEGTTRKYAFYIGYLGLSTSIIENQC